MIKTVAWACVLLLAVVLDASAQDVGVPVSCEAPCDGYVSLAIHAPSGELTRSLLYAPPVKAGRQNATWDGTDDLGRVCPLGDDPAGRSVGFDALVAVANQSGDRRERAMHRAGLSEGVVVDRPRSAELLPRTWGTLTFAPLIGE